MSAVTCDLLSLFYAVPTCPTKCACAPAADAMTQLGCHAALGTNMHRNFLSRVSHVSCECTLAGFHACMQFESAVIPEAQRAQQLAKRNVDLDEANAKLSAQVQVSNEKAKRCVDNAVKWQGQFDDEKSAHGYAC